MKCDIFDYEEDYFIIRIIACGFMFVCTEFVEVGNGEGEKCDISSERAKR